MKTDLNDLLTCSCGVVLEALRIMKRRDKNPNTPTEYYFMCPICNREVEK